MTMSVTTVVVFVSAIGLAGVRAPDVVNASVVRQSHLAHRNITLKTHGTQGERLVRVAEAVTAAQAGGPTRIATVSNLPSLGRGSDALAIDESGATIAGYSYDRSGWMHGVKWTLQSGAWAITDLPWPANATSTIATGVNNYGDVAGYDSNPTPASRALLWPRTGGVTVLGCATDAAGWTTVAGISTGAQVVVGTVRISQNQAITNVSAVIWRPGGSCLENLPPLVAGGYSAANAVNGDGTIVGGISTTVAAGPPLPVRWRNVAGQWQIEQLDGLEGHVLGANAAGDLTGYVNVPTGSFNCTSAAGCRRVAIWYVGGGSSVLPDTLGGDDSLANDINSSGEVIGISLLTRGNFAPFFWTSSAGMLQLPLRGSSAQAYAVSDLRDDGTRLVVGTSSSMAVA